MKNYVLVRTTNSARRTLYIEFVVDNRGSIAQLESDGKTKRIAALTTPRQQNGTGYGQNR